ncbi:MAG: hypothetical protein HC914_06105 [Chloroflexaceae bacterium]|nr:hypothetical protein [Chloroflexaceae bacterium]
MILMKHPAASGQNGVPVAAANRVVPNHWTKIPEQATGQAQRPSIRIGGATVPPGHVAAQLAR